jgi:hypothetical protein
MDNSRRRLPVLQRAAKDRMRRHFTRASGLIARVLPPLRMRTDLAGVDNGRWGRCLGRASAQQHVRSLLRRASHVCATSVAVNGNLVTCYALVRQIDPRGPIWLLPLMASVGLLAVFHHLRSPGDDRPQNS